MKEKVFLTVFFVLFLPNILTAWDYAFNFGGGLAFCNLKMDEIVYADSKSDDKTSLLEWDSGFLTGLEMYLFFGPKDLFNKMGFQLEGNIVYFFPGQNGYISDKDWDIDGSQYSEGHSDAVTMNLTEITGRLGYIFPPIKKQVYFGLNASVWYLRSNLLAHNGTLRQVAEGEPWYVNADKDNLYGTSISYIQEWIVITPELEAGFKIEKNLNLKIRFCYSPWIWGSCIDNHYFRDGVIDDNSKYTVWEDSVKGGDFIKIGGTLNWNIVRNINLSLFGEYKHIKNARGDSVIKTTGLVGFTARENNKAGAGMSNFSFGLMFSIDI